MEVRVYLYLESQETTTMPIYTPTKKLLDERKIINLCDLLLYGWVKSMSQT